MGSKQELKACKPENPSFPAPEQSNFHVYPDWAGMQAYYANASRIAFPPYCNALVTPTQAALPHPYIWPQPVMSPYGPYTAVYSHGGVYAHPTLAIGSDGHVVPSLPPVIEAMVPLNVENTGKSSGNSDQGLMKKLKGFDGLAMTIGTGNMDSSDVGGDHGISHSGETDGSTDVTDGNTAVVGENGKKRRRECTPTEGKKETKVLGMDLRIIVSSGGANAKMGGIKQSPSMESFELKKSPTLSAQASPKSVQVPSAILPPESWNEREMKREKRKQSNRESARRSRLRRLADELAKKVDALVAENIALKSEITRLAETSDKLRTKNGVLTGRLRSSEVGKTEQMLLDKVNNNAASSSVSAESTHF